MTELLKDVANYQNDERDLPKFSIGGIECKPPCIDFYSELRQKEKPDAIVNAVMIVLAEFQADWATPAIGIRKIVVGIVDDIWMQYEIAAQITETGMHHPDVAVFGLEHYVKQAAEEISDSEAILPPKMQEVLLCKVAAEVAYAYTTFFCKMTFEKKGEIDE